jgi:hypothetical protein
MEGCCVRKEKSRSTYTSKSPVSGGQEVDYKHPRSTNRFGP